MTVSVVSAQLADGSTPDFSPDKPDLVVAQDSGLEWNTYRGGDITDPERGVDLNYEVRGTPLQAPPEVAFYWADASKNKIGGPLPLDPSTVLAALSGPYQVTEPARWGPEPPEARYILAVLDPNHLITETDETNNMASLPIHTRAEILRKPLKWDRTVQRS